MITLSITTADGKTTSFQVERMPKYWKSWLMHQLPYGTSFQGAKFSAS